MAVEPPADDWWRPSVLKEPEDAPSDAEWVKAIRDGGTIPYLPSNNFKGFMERNFIRGKTTEADVFKLLGQPSKEGPKVGDLDRPARDGVVSYQYWVYNGNDNVNYLILVLHFDAKTRILLDAGRSESICGFCPHIYVIDGSWRLEGKMLAGRVGKARRGTDTMVLPRLATSGDRYQIKISNLAPEIEFISDVRLAAVPLAEGQELDVSVEGAPVVWTSHAEVSLELQNWAVIPVPPGVDSLVLELRNTGEFEEEMRGIFLEGRAGTRRVDLLVSFDGQQPIEVAPVGTKLLRRVVVPVPADARQVNLRCHAEFWFTRRCWFGRSSPGEPVWLMPLETKPIELAMHEEAVLEFPVPGGLSGKVGYALAMTGYYEFISKARTLAK